MSLLGGEPAPALFTRMSILPNRLKASSTIAFTWALLVTSVLDAIALRPRACTSAAVCFAPSKSVSAATECGSRARN